MEAKDSWGEVAAGEVVGGAAMDKEEKRDMATMAGTAEWKRCFTLMGIPPAVIANEVKAILAFLEMEGKGELGSSLPGRRPAYFQPKLSRRFKPKNPAASVRSRVNGTDNIY
jgi:hypothetical protein